MPAPRLQWNRSLYRRGQVALYRSQFAAEATQGRLGVNRRTGCWEFVDLKIGLAPRVTSQGEFICDPETGIIFVWIPGGEYLMGSPEDEPGRKNDEHQHRVVVSPFLISKYEITQSQWQKVMGQNPSKTVGPTHPVDTISWDDCQKFCAKTGAKLPTEAEWQFACRAGTVGPYCNGEPLEEFSWGRQNTNNTTHPVG